MSTENFNTKIYIKAAGYITYNSICKLKKLYIKLQKWINKVNKVSAIFLQSKWRTTSENEIVKYINNSKSNWLFIVQCIFLVSQVSIFHQSKRWRRKNN